MTKSGYNQVDSWNEVLLIYRSALKEINTKLEILNDEFQHVHRYNPIEHIKSRIKTSESIVKKLKKKGYESTIENMVEYVNDIAGVRVICFDKKQVYFLVNEIRNWNQIIVLKEKDYIYLVQNKECTTEQFSHAKNQDLLKKLMKNSVLQ